jgi:hypothetical protein
MKKILFLIIIIGLVLAVSSCKRTEIDDPSWEGPAGFNILLEGSVNPALLLIDGHMHTSQIYVRVTDAKNNPLAGETIFIEQLADSTSHEQIDWGYFSGGYPTVQKVTNANGEINVTFYWPTEWQSSTMWIHALMVVGDRSYRGSNSHIGNVPEDFISLTMISSPN